LRTRLANVGAAAHMEVNETFVEDCKEQVHRVTRSNTFRNAVMLQSLLQFLTDKAIKGDSGNLKEYTIGVESLGRKSDFDPRADPIVRVQCHRLRVRLKEYYEVEGVLDPIRIQLSKGHYAPTFEAMPKAASNLTGSSHGKREARDHASAVQGTSEASKEEIASRGSRIWRTRFAICVGAILLIVVGYLLSSWRAERKSRDLMKQASRLGMVEAFWARILGNDKAPVIAYTNAVFLLDDSNDLFRFRRGAVDNRGALVDSHLAREFAANPDIVSRAGQLFYENGYTGTGDLQSVATFVGLFARMGLKPILKSSRDVTPDDLSQHNVILVGSPFQNPAVEEMMPAGDFSFYNPDQHHEQWRGEILNSHPRQGEASIFRTERDAATKTLTADFSVITIASSSAPGCWIVVVGGLDTKGTEGATQLITSEEGVDRLNAALDSLGGGSPDLPPFQALARIQLSKGYQVLNASLVSVHLIRPSKTQAAPNSVAAR
jgi:hypothetical protein